MRVIRSQPGLLVTEWSIANWTPSAYYTNRAAQTILASMLVSNAEDLEGYVRANMHTRELEGTYSLMRSYDAAKMRIENVTGVPNTLLADLDDNSVLPAGACDMIMSWYVAYSTKKKG